MESGMLDDFIERKHGRAKITYMFPQLEEILKPTYGVIVYQEQVMQIVQTIGGFSLGGADLVRRAMGKKIKEEMDRLQNEFANGAAQKGFDITKATEPFDLIVKFAGYGFNKSHSAAYALVTFYTAYLKKYHPTEFMAALLTLEKDNTTKVVKYVDEAKRMGMELLPPDVNRSDLVFTPSSLDAREIILFGMGAIKGVGDIAVRSILKSKSEGGEFRDLSDFISRIDTTKVNKKVIESLIKSGAMDCFGYSRKAMLDSIELILESSNKVSQAKKMSIGSLFGDDSELTTIEINIPNGKEYEAHEILELEKATLGFYVSGHPLDKYKEELEGLNYTLSSEISELSDGSEALFVGKIENIVEKISKKGHKFGIANIMDLHGNIELMLFEDRLKELENDFDTTQPIAFKVRISKDDNFTRMNLLKIETLKDAKKERVKVKKEQKPIDEAPKEFPIALAIDLAPNFQLIEELFHLAQKYQGTRSLELHIKSKLADVIVESRLKVSDLIIQEAKAIGIYPVEELMVG
jgi:DNA polymerase-3 subunit alpha